MHKLYRLRKIFKYINGIYQRNFKKIDKNFNKYDNYEDYLNHQLVKTQDPKRIELWLKDEWEFKCEGFLNIFTETKIYNESELISYFKNSKILKNNKIENIHDPMDRELIFKRI